MCFIELIDVKTYNSNNNNNSNNYNSTILVFVEKNLDLMSI